MATHTDSPRLLFRTSQGTLKGPSSPHDALRARGGPQALLGGSLGKRKIRPGPRDQAGGSRFQPASSPFKPKSPLTSGFSSGNFPSKALQASRAPRLLLVLPPLSWNPRKFHTAWPSGSPLTCLPSSPPATSAAPSRGHFCFLEDGGHLRRLSFLGGGGRLTRPTGLWTQIPKHLHLGARN